MNSTIQVSAQSSVVVSSVTSSLDTLIVFYIIVTVACFLMIGLAIFVAYIAYRQCKFERILKKICGKNALPSHVAASSDTKRDIAVINIEEENVISSSNKSLARREPERLEMMPLRPSPTSRTADDDERSRVETSSQVVADVDTAVGVQTRLLSNDHKSEDDSTKESNESLRTRLLGVVELRPDDPPPPDSPSASGLFMLSMLLSVSYHCLA